LDALLDGIQHALDIEEKIGIVNLDGEWCNTEPIPFLQSSDPTSITNEETTSTNFSTSPPNEVKNKNKPHKWVRKARLVLSPYARPTGWYLQFDNRSIVYALLRHAKEHPIRSTWRSVRLKEHRNNHYHNSNDNNDDTNGNHDPVSYGNFILNDDISDSTLRVENCPYYVTEASMLNFFSRYDLISSVGTNNGKPIQLWHGITTDGRVCPPTTYLVHFADRSWARAALREKQGTFMSKMGQPVVDHRNPKPLHLIQYPRQML
jgi:hypothetical protein